MGLITEYSLWFLLLCIGFGAAYAFFLYYHRERYLTEVSASTKRWMALLRFVFASFLCFFLLTPLLRNLKRTVEKPMVIVAQDNSESVVLGKDSAYYRKEYINSLNKLVNDLSERFEVRTFSVGDHVKQDISGDFRDKQTDLSAVFNEISSRYANRNVGAVILASDGIYNQGSNPYYAAEKLKIPLYTVALGDTTVHRDLVLSRVNYNHTAYLGNNMPLEITVDADKCKGETTTLTIEKDGAVVLTKNIELSSNNFHALVPAVLEAKPKGISHYVLQLSSVKGEMTRVNNRQDIYINVLENREKILLLYNSPHPDVSAIKKALENTENYELKIMPAQDFSGNLSSYNLMILHQLPSNTNAASAVLSALKGSKTSVLYILGLQSGIRSFNTSQTSVFVESNSTRATEALPSYNPDFSLFVLSDNARKALDEYPPLSSPFGTYKNAGSGTSLLNQQIGNVKTNQPLISFSEIEGRRTAVICGEGIWRWRLKDYSINGNFNQFDELLLKTVQYLSVKEEKKHLRIIAKNNFLENEPVQISAEVYNESFELVSTGELNITIGSGNKKFPFVFSRAEKTYSLNAGYFPVGKYSYSGSVKLGDKEYRDAGEFTVSALQFESLETTADHQLLYKMASESGGKMFYPKDLDKLGRDLLARNDIKAISYSESNMEDLISVKWILVLLVLLVSLEWFLRKRNGAY